MACYMLIHFTGDIIPIHWSGNILLLAFTFYYRVIDGDCQGHSTTASLLFSPYDILSLSLGSSHYFCSTLAYQKEGLVYLSAHFLLFEPPPNQIFFVPLQFLFPLSENHYGGNNIYTRQSENFSIRPLLKGLQCESDSIEI